MTTRLSATDKYANQILSPDGLTLSHSGINDQGMVRAVDPLGAAMYYGEMRCLGTSGIEGLNGVTNAAANLFDWLGYTSQEFAFIGDKGNVYSGFAVVATYDIFKLGDDVAFCFDNVNKRQYYKVNNGFWNKSATANPDTNTGGLSYSGITGTIYMAASALRDQDTGVFRFARSSWLKTPPVNAIEIGPVAASAARTYAFMIG